MGLNAKQARFVDEYLVDLNATQAAIRAGYSAKTAASKGFSLLRIVEIAKEVERRQAETSEKTGVTREQVLERLWVEANYDGEGSSHSARVSALSWLGKHHGTFLDRVDHTSGGQSLPSSIRIELVKPADE